MRFSNYSFVFIILFIAMANSFVFANEIVDKVTYVTNRLGCQFPYFLVQFQDTDRFLAETKVIDPEKIKNYGLVDANIGDIIAIEEIRPEQYIVRVAHNRPELEQSDEVLIRIEFKSKNKPQKTVKQKTLDEYVLIKGIIENWEIAWPYLKDNTYLQLVEYKEEQDFKTKIVDGRLNLISDLPRTFVSNDGSFEFRLKMLNEGIYSLYLQNFELAIDSRPQLYGMLTKGDEFFELIVNEPTSMASFNCGKLRIKKKH